MDTVRVLERDEHEAEGAEQQLQRPLLLELLWHLPLLLLWHLPLLLMWLRVPPPLRLPLQLLPLLLWLPLRLLLLLLEHLPPLLLVLLLLLPQVLQWRQQGLQHAWSPLLFPSSSFETCRTQSVEEDESPNETFKSSIKDWQKGAFLGRGAFGTVHEGFTADGSFFAVKEVSLCDQGSQGNQSIEHLEQEISLLSQFKHENIVRYLGTDKDDSNLYIFLELVTQGSLAELYKQHKLGDSQVSAYTRQILNGLNYLHGQNVVHRDIKCANILVNASGSVKLADFGLAKATKVNDLKSFKGTPYWMAPEVVKRTNHGYGLAADIWSLGCTVLEMLTREIPYSGLEPQQALFRIGRGEPPLIPSSLPSEAQDFISKCLQVVPDDRPTAAQLLDHPFVNRPLSTFGD